jgi:CBS domain-containing protein
MESMKQKARDVMVTEFDTVQSDQPVIDAVRLIYHGKIRQTGYKTVGLVVTDHFGDLVGVVSMFDILYHLRPPILNYLGDSMSLEITELRSYINRFKDMTVGDVMSTPVKYVSPDTEIIEIVDQMVKDRCRRFPVVENSKVIGIVYLPEIYMHVCRRWLDIDL